MKKFLIALASAAVLAAPLAGATVTSAQAAPHGGYHGGYGGYRGGWGGYRGGFYGGWGRGFYGGFWPGYYGFALGAALASPWYYSPYYYGWYGAYGPGYAYPAPGYGYPAAPAPQAPPSGASAPTAQVPPGASQGCGQWVWDQAQNTYHWQAGACSPQA